ncbi:MAG: arginine--tRNA ligase [Planctomycetota bacterium]|jgi:arginyl-tRNA synthetase
MEAFKKELARVLASTLGSEADDLLSLFEYPPRRELGDLAFPCFPLAKTLRKAPKIIAEELADRIEAPGFVDWIRATGPYLNFGLDRGELCGSVIGAARAAGREWGSSSDGAGKTVVVDYSSPNVSKHLAFHHLRSTMIGQSLVNLHRATGWNTVGINHLGDWGTTFGKLMVAVKRWTDSEFLKGATLEDLNKLYVRFHGAAESESSMEGEARDWFKRLEEGDPEARSMWSSFREISLHEFGRAYDRLGVSFDHMTGESFFEDGLDGTVTEVKRCGITSISEGALVVDLEADGMPPALLRKSDGATLYLTRDIAAALYRHDSFGFDRALYVTDAGQALHFRQLFRVLEMMGRDFSKAMVHVPFGVILMGGQRGKTRKGEVVLLSDVLDEAQDRTGAMIEKKNPDLADASAVASAVGIGAVVFNDLKNKRIKDVNFDWEEVLSLDGDSGPYVQYAHVRACGIFRKFGGPAPEKADLGRLVEEAELDLVHKIGRFPETVRRAAETFELSVVAQYLLEVAASFHRFHHHHRVLSDDGDLTAARLMLVDAARHTLKNGLTLLAIDAPEEM